VDNVFVGMHAPETFKIRQALCKDFHNPVDLLKSNVFFANSLSYGREIGSIYTLFWAQDRIFDMLSIKIKQGCRED